MPATMSAGSCRPCNTTLLAFWWHKGALPAVHISTPHCHTQHVSTMPATMSAGSCRPCSTTLLAFWWHKGALWAIPDVPLNSSSSSRHGGSSSRHRSSSSRKADQPVAGPPGYRVVRLDMNSNKWEEVLTQVRQQSFFLNSIEHLPIDYLHLPVLNLVAAWCGG
jgi:hypothetical protein